MAFAGGKQAPGQYDAMLSGVPIMLLRLDERGAPSIDGVLQWHAERLPYSPGQTTPEGAPYFVEPSMEQPEGFYALSGGMGARVQDPKRDRDTDQYYYAHWIDGAGDIVFNAPATTTITPTTIDAANGINDFFTVTIGGVEYVCALEGRYVIQRTADTNAGWGNQSFDFGAGKNAIRAENFRGTQASPYTFIALGSGTKYYVWDWATATTTFTQHASLTALDFRVYRNELWMLNTDANGAYNVQKCLDGGTAPTWSGAFIMADSTNQCTNFEIHDDRLYVRSQKGLLAVSAGETSPEMLTGSEFSYVDLVPNNCRMVDFLQWLLVPMYRSYYSYMTDGTVEEIGLTSLRRNDSPISGYPLAACAYGTWYVLVAFWNEANNTCYLMKWGNWKIYSTLFSPIPKRVFVPAWQGPLFESSVKIQSIRIFEAAGGPYAYLGMADGTVVFYRLPRNGPDATGDTTWTQFNTTNPFQLFCPAITRGNPGISKAATGVEITGQNLNATVSYRTGRSGAYGGSNNLQNSGLFNSDPGSRNSFTTSVITRWLDLLVTGTATDSATPCIVETVVAYVVPRPPFKFVFTLKMLIGDRVLTKNNNIIQEYDTPGWLTAIQNLCETGPVTVTTPEGNTFLAIITDFKLDPYYSDVKGRDIEYVGTVQLMQHLSIANQGQHGHVGNYSHQYLGAYTHGGIKTL